MKIFVGCSSKNEIPNKYKEDCAILFEKLFQRNDLLSFLNKIYEENFTMDYIKDSYYVSNNIDEIVNYITKVGI